MSVILRCIFCSLLSGVLLSFFMSAAYPQDIPAIQDPQPLGNAPASPSVDGAAPAPNQPRKKIVYREKSYFEFEDTLINGNLRAPDGSFIFRKSQSKFSSALNLRRSFIPELKASSNDAR